ncbi:hypothetical protein Xen7305DRAFT_00014620 [Xenococcus sp. PCC 7305]|uniref:hypothetical protein n=1 Tax=Xenococcus sp. PCC 7305 TaxID=102125 RepID=UPI0002AC18A9|nr:hypothetical protein [Xenococcus sp. PCC 7305]ELS01757.1 hypothetical protein Xen7305DRAFT_00014620 [Xenococcus sp. PCC 7305]
MSRKRRRRGRKNPVRRIFAFISKLIRNLFDPAIAPKQKRKRRRRRRSKKPNLISPILAMGNKFFSDRQQPALNSEKKPPKQIKKRKLRGKAKLEIRSHGRDVKITRIQK